MFQLDFICWESMSQQVADGGYSEMKICFVSLTNLFYTLSKYRTKFSMYCCIINLIVFI